MQNISRHFRVRDEKNQFTTHALWALILPLVLEQLLSVTIGMADTVMVSRTGDAAVSAVSLVDSINNLLIQLFSALATGGAVVTSQYLGAQDLPMARRSGKQLIYASVLLAAAISLPCALLRGGILDALFHGVEPDVMRGCSEYFILGLFSYPFLALYSSCTALFRAQGDSRTPLCCSILMNVANIGGNAYLIYGLNLGVFGAGLATLISRAAGGVFMLCMLQRRSSELRISNLLRPEFDGGMILRILRIGVPSGLENSLFQVGKVLLSRLVSSLGTYAIAANAISWTMASLLCVPVNSVGVGLLTISGVCMGAGNPDGAEYYTRKLVRVAYIGMGVTCGLMQLFIEPLSGLFGLSEPSRVLACQVIRLYAVMVFLEAPISFVVPSLLRGAGDVKFPMLVSALSMWGFRVGASYLLCNGLNLGLRGVWYAMYLDWTCRCICFFWRMVSGRWRRFRVI